jgi:hypothetical protein
MMETHIVTESKTDRRSFLAAALAATGSALTSSACQAETEGHASGAQEHVTAKSTLSFDSLYDTSVLATTLKGEAADRLALRRLVDAWARCADRRLAEEQSNLFVEDGTILNYEGDPATHKPHSTIKVEWRSAPLWQYSISLRSHSHERAERSCDPGRSRNRRNLLFSSRILGGKRPA